MLRSPLRLRRGMGADIEHPFAATKNGQAFPEFPIGGALTQWQRSTHEVLITPPVWQFLKVPGSRFYVDHDMLENATPLCDNAEDVVAYIHAGYRRLAAWVDEFLDHLHSLFPGDRYEVGLYANNVSKFGEESNSCGSHENYQIIADNIQTFGEALVGYFVSGVLLYGSGRLRHDDGFEISQRAGFFTETYGKTTTKDRPIINLRDAPYARGCKRLHVIVRDNSINPRLDILKRKDLQLLLTIREEYQLEGLMPLDPPRAIQDISLTPGVHFQVQGRGDMTALELAYHYYDQQMRYLTHPRNRDVAAQMLPWIKLKGRHLGRLSRSLDPSDHYRQLDWATRQVILAKYQDRGLSGEELRTRDHQLQKINGRGSGWSKLMAGYDLDEAAVQRALAGPPTTTRAWAQAQLIEQHGPEIYQIGWDRIYTGTKRFMLPDPLDPTVPEAEPLPAVLRLAS